MRASLKRPSAVAGDGGRASLTVLLAFAVTVGASWTARAQSGPARQPNPFNASTSRQSREDAIRSIPLDKLEPSAQGLVRSVLSDVTVFRRLPTRVIQCDPEMYLFLVQHPDVVVNIWQLFGITEISLEQISSEAYHLTDSAGTDGIVRFLYRSYDTHLVYSEGKYEGPLSTKPTRGRALLLLKTGYLREADGRCYITARLDAFLQVEPGGVELLTKTFQPLVGKIADLNFVQTAAFVGSLSKTAEANSDGVQRLASKLTKVEPDIRSELAQLAERVAQKAAGADLYQVPNREPAVAQAPDENTVQ